VAGDGRLVTDEGDAAACVDGAVDRYLLDLQAPEDGLTCRPETPETPGTSATPGTSETSAAAGG
jgi:hypothetical protein